MTASPDELLRHAETLMRRRDWAQAAAVFEQVPPESRDTASSLKRRLSVNLASLRLHRPEVYDTVLALPSQQSFSIGATPSGKPTVHCRRPDGSVVSFAAGPDPLMATAAALPTLYQRTPSGEAIGLCGVGDGYLAQLLAQRPPKLFMDKQQAVLLIEPEPHVLLQCLMIHDFTGAAGPIEQSRFQWFVGPDWAELLQRFLLADAYFPCPTVTVGQGFDTQRIQSTLGSIVQRLVDRDAEQVAEIDRHYASLAPAALVPLFECRGERAPRVLLLTTRFSTVLQYSTRDTAAAFERLGWETRVIIEPSPHHRVLRSAIAAALAEFKPDLVVQIDHLRNEHHGLFPRTLPFACWIQDHLPHLASPEVGRRVGELDFILTDAIATYVEKFDYPQRQCIPLSKLVNRTEFVDLDAADAALGDDLVFVSNASGMPDGMIAEAVARHARSPQTEALITRCCRTMVETYEQGHSLPTYNDVCGVLRRTLHQLGLSLASESFDVLARWLTHPFNDALYRQQALRWAAATARDQGHTLALYGTGWDAHPEFAPYSRGPVAYGEPLRQLTRRSRINLQIVPYLCLHQRLLDGLMAGGFFLIRTHPADIAPAALLRFLESESRPTPQSISELNKLIDACRPCLCTTGNEDVVAMVRAWQEAGQLTVEDGPLPMLDDVGFRDAHSLASRIAAYVGSASKRRSIVTAQRRSVSARFTYDAGVRRVVARLRELLAETAGTMAMRRAA